MYSCMYAWMYMYSSTIAPSFPTLGRLHNHTQAKPDAWMDITLASFGLPASPPPLLASPLAAAQPLERSQQLFARLRDLGGPRLHTDGHACTRRPARACTGPHTHTTAINPTGRITVACEHPMCTHGRLSAKPREAHGRIALHPSIPPSLRALSWLAGCWGTGADWITVGREVRRTRLRGFERDWRDANRG
eukprot:GHVU01045535.1.p1 GENE.GHVU01045535.1~~GHVU01045535.1.p1  ORF type:complete len:191 (+),score=11.03 GHVU01045535.1:63-635(+)